MTQVPKTHKTIEKASSKDVKPNRKQSIGGYQNQALLKGQKCLLKSTGMAPCDQDRLSIASADRKPPTAQSSVPQSIGGSAHVQRVHHH
jgi:hypothetical protein